MKKLQKTIYVLKNHQKARKQISKKIQKQGKLISPLKIKILSLAIKTK
jgi:hypothetical protein